MENKNSANTGWRCCLSLSNILLPRCPCHPDWALELALTLAWLPQKLMLEAAGMESRVHIFASLRASPKTVSLYSSLSKSQQMLNVSKCENLTTRCVAETPEAHLSCEACGAVFHWWFFRSPKIFRHHLRWKMVPNMVPKMVSENRQEVMVPTPVSTAGHGPWRPHPSGPVSFKRKLKRRGDCLSLLSSSHSRNINGWNHRKTIGKP